MQMAGCSHRHMPAPLRSADTHLCGRQWGCGVASFFGGRHGPGMKKKCPNMGIHVSLPHGVFFKKYIY